MKDIRHKGCKDIKYIEKLPSVSVIFPFHDEVRMLQNVLNRFINRTIFQHFSTLLRSAYSIINRSPPGIVKEIILVDDASTKSFLKQPLEDHLKEHKIDHIVKVLALLIDCLSLFFLFRWSEPSEFL